MSLDRQSVQEKIIAHIRENMPDDEELTETTDLINGYFLDSLKIVSLTLFLETEFNTPFSGADINEETFSNAISLTDFVLAKA